MSRLADGYRVSGTAVFRHARQICALRYDVSVDPSFRTRSARVVGHVGARPVDTRIRATSRGRWRIDGVVRDDLADCLDVDLAFTPATNMLPIRRLGLRIGERAEAPAVYLAFPSMKVSRLGQSYRRVGRRAYAYAAPRFRFTATLQVSAIGTVIRYPGLFERVPAAGRKNSAPDSSRRRKAGIHAREDRP